MATKVIKTAGQVAFEDFQSQFPVPMPFSFSEAQDKWEAFAAKHNIQPLTEEVADKPTDGELFERAWIITNYNGEKAAAEFLRLLRERTGEPLPVTGQYLHDRWHTDCVHEDSPWDSLADKINQHRGVRPVPQVTVEMACGAISAYRTAPASIDREDIKAAADYLNAELAKAVAPLPVTPMKVAAYATLNSHLHTFQDAEDMKAFTRANDFSQAGYIVGHEHHPRKDGTP